MRRDLRTGNNPALLAAGRAGDVLPLFVRDPQFSETSRRVGVLGDILTNLQKEVPGMVLRHGEPEKEVLEVALAAGVKEVYITKDFSPYGRARDERVREALKQHGIFLVEEGSSYAVEPGSINKDGGGFYKVYGAFYKQWRENLKVGNPHISNINWAEGRGIDSTWRIEKRSGTEMQWGMDNFNEFLTKIDQYPLNRHRPDLDGTSKISTALKFGTIHPNSLIWLVENLEGSEEFLRQICWREWFADLLYRNPDLAWADADKNSSVKTDTDGRAAERFKTWCEGKTGYPIVDAGMRQLLEEGWMPNRVRMIVGSFMLKDLHLPWQWGARWFMKNLIDGDLASNNLSWQWLAGTGLDAAPYHRIFNPSLQSAKFDPEGIYIQKWVKELSDVFKDKLHEPGCSGSYIQPMVDHNTERIEALDRWRGRKKNS